MTLTVKIAKPDGRTSVSITVNVHESDKPVDFRNTAMADVMHMDKPLSPSLPFLTHQAIEAACCSGARYARHKLGVSGLFVELLSYSYSGEVESAEPFAIAVMIAACKSGSESVVFSEGELNGWREVPS